MGYKLFIDDERMPVGTGWVIVRNYQQAVDMITKYGLPEYISFDHDLGERQRTGHDIAKFIVDYCLDNDLKMDFEFYVHSQNPIGKKNIEALLNSFKGLTYEQKSVILKSAGWETLWADDNWIRKEWLDDRNINIDWAGHSTDNALKRVLGE